MRIKIKEKKIFKNLIKDFFNIQLTHVDSFCTDSRQLQRDDIFMPIKGNEIDPHCFISDISITI